MTGSQYSETMTAEEFKAAQHRAGMTNAGTAQYLGVSERTVYRYRSGASIPGPVARAMRDL